MRDWHWYVSIIGYPVVLRAGDLARRGRWKISAVGGRWCVFIVVLAFRGNSHYCVKTFESWAQAVEFLEQSPGLAGNVLYA